MVVRAHSLYRSGACTLVRINACRSAYLSDRKVSVALVRTIRDYFNRRYDQYTAFADHEYKYFQQLPGNLRMELARQLKYLDHHTDTSKPGLLSRVSWSQVHYSLL